MRGLLLAVAIVMMACPPRPPPTPLAAAPDAGPCAHPAQVLNADVCDGIFTAGGYACVSCPGLGSCIDRDLQVYCAAPSCAGDPACRLEREDSLFEHRRRR